MIEAKLIELRMLAKFTLKLKDFKKSIKPKLIQKV